MKFKHNDIVSIKYGLHKGRSGRIFAHVFWIIYLLDMPRDGHLSALWFNIKHDVKQEFQNES